MKKLLELFAPSSSDRETMDELLDMLDHSEVWHRAHDLFSRIRRKTLIAERTQNHDADCQYLFEEICAKTLYNLTMRPAPFDADSPYWIIPNALALARSRNIPHTRILDIVAA